MSEFHKGQEVEVLERWQVGRMKPQAAWRKAKILGRGEPYSKTWRIQFPDGTRAVVDADHIRARFPLGNHQMRFGSSPAVSHER